MRKARERAKSGEKEREESKGKAGKAQERRRAGGDEESEASARGGQTGERDRRTRVGRQKNRAKR